MHLKPGIWMPCISTVCLCALGTSVHLLNLTIKSGNRAIVSKISGSGISQKGSGDAGYRYYIMGRYVRGNICSLSLKNIQ